MYYRLFSSSLRRSAMIGNSRRSTGLLWTCAVISSSFAYAQTKTIVDDVPAMPVVTASDPKHAEIELKLDIDKKEFSVDNGLFFATLSKIAYLTKDEAEASLLGNDTMKGMGFDQFYWYEADEDLARAHYFDKIDDTEGFVAANDEALVVVFRGTQEAIDWSTNIRVIGRRVPEAWAPDLQVTAELHGGFDDGLNTIWERQGMLDVVRKLYHEEVKGGKKRKLYLAGHSLGGALATVAAAHLLFSENMQIAGMYTIGSPRVFDYGMAKIFDEKMSDGTPMKERYFRCRNNNDVVPRVPPGYTHVGTEVYFDRLGMISEGTSFLDRILGRLNALVRGEIVDGVHDHSSNEYLRLFKQAVTRAKVSVLGKTKGIAIDVVRKVVPGGESEAREEEIKATKEAAVEMSKEL